MGKDERITDDLKEIIKKIDKMDVSTPDLVTMVNFVSDEQTRLAAKNNKQLAVFSCTAMAIIAVLIMIYQLSSMAFVIVQGLFLLVPIVQLLFMRGRRNGLL